MQCNHIQYIYQIIYICQIWEVATNFQTYLPGNKVVNDMDGWVMSGQNYEPVEPTTHSPAQ